MKLNIKKTLAFLIIFNVMISGLDLGLANLAYVHAEDIKTNSSVDVATGATINIQKAIEKLKNKVTEAEQICNNAVKEENKNKYTKEAIEKFKNEIENVKSKLENKSIASNDIAETYNKLQGEIVTFESSIIKEEKDKTKDDNVTKPVDTQKPTEPSENNKQEVRINAAVVGMYNEIIVEPNAINLKGDTVEDVLKLNGIKYELDKDGTIKSINDIVNGTKTEDELDNFYRGNGFYGENSKWICVVNGKEIKDSIKTSNIKSGDYVIFYYSNDGKIPSYNSSKNDFININVKLFNVESKKLVEEKVLALKGSNEYFVAKNVFKKLGITDIKCAMKTGYIKADGHEVRVIVNEDAKTVKKIFTEIKENDDVVIYESGYDCSEAPYFSKIEISSKEVKKGETIEISVLKVYDDWDADEEGVYTYLPAGKVRVYFGDKTYETDDEGKVTVKCDTAGEFQVYAKHDEMFISEDNDYENFILPSNRIKVVVKGEGGDTSADNITKEVNKEELINLINDARTLYKNSEEGEIEGKYTKENKNKLSDEITISINVVSDKQVTEEQVNDEVQRLKSVMEEFKKSVIKINVEELTKLVEEALKINNSAEIGSAQGQYREDDKEKFENEIKNAKKLLKNKNKMQKDVDDEVIKLKNAVEQFKKSVIDIRKNFNVEAVNLPKELKKGSSAELTINATNTTKENKQVCFIIGVFDNNDKLIKYSAIRKVVKSGERVELTGSSKLPNEDGYKVKAFVWNSLEGMKLLSNSIEISVK